MKAKYTVLVIEDEREQRESLAKIVEETGLCRVLTAENGRHAQRVLSKNRRGFGLFGFAVDCIFLDFQMPEMTGEDFLIWLRKIEAAHFFIVGFPLW